MPPSSADWLKILQPQPLGVLEVYLGLYGNSFNLRINIIFQLAADNASQKVTLYFRMDSNGLNACIMINEGRD
jgi:hypothetical protein